MENSINKTIHNKVKAGMIAALKNDNLQIHN